MASVMEAATGERFDRLMHRLVLAPLQPDACFDWPTRTDATVARGAARRSRGPPLARRSPRPTPRPPRRARHGRCLRPDPPAGRRVSTRGLATIGLLLAGAVDGVRLPTHDAVETLLSPVWTHDGGSGMTGGTTPGSICAYGLATQVLPTARAGCRDRLFADGRRRVGQAGEACLRSGLWIDRGRGGACPATTVPDAGTCRRSAFTRSDERLAYRGRRGVR